MDSLRREYKDLIFEKKEFENSRVEELLGHEPELLKLYDFRRSCYERADKLRTRIKMCMELGTPFVELIKWVCDYKDLKERAEESGDIEGVANDLADALEIAAEQLQRSASEIRQQAAELKTPASEKMMQRVEEAQSRAAKEAEQRYGSRLSELRHKILD